LLTYETQVILSLLLSMPMTMIMTVIAEKHIYTALYTGRSFRSWAGLINCCRLCRSTQASFLALFSWLEPVVVAFTTAVVERLAQTKWTHVRVADHVVRTRTRFLRRQRTDVYIQTTIEPWIIDVSIGITKREQVAQLLLRKSRSYGAV